MKFIYPAVFEKQKNGRYRGYFPDLEGCQAEGETLEDAVEHANEAANDWIMVELEDPDGQMPPVTDLRDIILKENEVVRNINVNLRLMEGWEE